LSAACSNGTDALKVGVEAAFGDIVGVADVAAHHGFFSTDFTHFRHDGTLLDIDVQKYH
jgi:hypothetical protein